MGRRFAGFRIRLTASTNAITTAFTALIAAGLAWNCSDTSYSTGPPADTAQASNDSGYAETILDPEYLSKPWGKALGDVDGDGFIDALVGSAGGPIYWYRYPGWQRTRISGIHGGDDLQIGDLDGDGRNDVASNGSSIVWYRNPGGTGSGVWTAQTLRAESGAHDLAILDVDGDGRNDLAARVENGPTFIFFRNSDGTWHTANLHLASGGTGMAFDDIDGDGRMDLVESGYWLRQPEDPRSGDWERGEIAAWSITSSAGITDMNGDGRGDVFLARGHGLGRLSWFEAPSDPLNGTWKEHFIDSAAYVHRLHVADVDDDGDMDVIFAEQQEAPKKRVGIFRNDDEAGTKWSYIGIADAGAHNIAIGDIGKDGDLDVLGANWTGDTRPRLWIKE